METRHFRVQCIDRETGHERHHVLEGTTTKEVSDLANRMGYIVGKIHEVPSLEVRRFPILLSLLFLVVGVGLGVGGLFASRVLVPSQIQSVAESKSPDTKTPLAYGVPQSVDLPSEHHLTGSVETAPASNPEVKQETAENKGLQPVDTTPEPETEVPAVAIETKPLVAETVTREYDRFHDKTSIRSRIYLNSNIQEKKPLSLLTSGDGETLSVRSLTGTQISAYLHNAPLDEIDLVFLTRTDDRVERITVRTRWGRGDMHYGYLSLKDLNTIAFADSVEAKWWIYDGTIDLDSLTTLQDHITYIRE